MKKPRICAVIVNNDLKAVKDVEPLVDLFEVRIDIIGDGWQKLVKQLEKPWIATNRTMDEGGKWGGNEARRIEGLLQAIELGADMVDVEFKTKNLENIVPLVKKRVKCILSYHNLEKTPPLDEMKRIVHRQLKAGADICKLVTWSLEFLFIQFDKSTLHRYDTFCYFPTTQNWIDELDHCNAKDYFKYTINNFKFRIFNMSVQPCNVFINFIFKNIIDIVYI